MPASAKGGGRFSGGREGEDAPPVPLAGFVLLSAPERAGRGGAGPGAVPAALARETPCVGDGPPAPSRFVRIVVVVLPLSPRRRGDRWLGVESSCGPRGRWYNRLVVREAGAVLEGGADASTFGGAAGCWGERWG